MQLYLIPFLHQTTTGFPSRLTRLCCILFHFYIKPQPCEWLSLRRFVVSYSISTSNHNLTIDNSEALKLYLIPFLHQTTTIWGEIPIFWRCILFHFYIKPQLGFARAYYNSVVSYSISTSNHNVLDFVLFASIVVSYSISTSNHNFLRVFND